MGIWLDRGMFGKGAPRIFRHLFPELEGGLFHLSFHKSWTTIFKYLLKEDKDIYILGKQTGIKMQETVKAPESHKKLPRHSEVIISKWKGC